MGSCSRISTIRELVIWMSVGREKNELTSFGVSFPSILSEEMEVSFLQPGVDLGLHKLPLTELSSSLLQESTLRCFKIVRPEEERFQARAQPDFASLPPSISFARRRCFPDRRSQKPNRSPLLLDPYRRSFHRGGRQRRRDLYSSSQLSQGRARFQRFRRFCERRLLG